MTPTARRWCIRFGLYLVDCDAEGRIPLNARIHAEFKHEPAPSVAALLSAAPELLALVQEGAELSAHESPDESTIADYRHRCARLAARVTGQA